MDNIEVPSEQPSDVIAERLRVADSTTDTLRQAGQEVNRPGALRRYAELTGTDPQEHIETMKREMAAQRQAAENNKPFMGNYTRRMWAEAEKKEVDPLEYIALRTLLDVNPERLSA
ncbi:hypothetical protein COU76_01225 [Candidatus Peregrinibacteria bacterium CG10_big_fil_rev_8_21_14_0_10_49_10]|nr:MAG: hypothetical protein COU76_01225 [Candidatus Peregrinibacteria bacterium CG10_big_fil_rev_8_21_14_0_10_49_10]